MHPGGGNDPRGYQERAAQAQAEAQAQAQAHADAQAGLNTINEAQAPSTSGGRTASDSTLRGSRNESKKDLQRENDLQEMNDDNDDDDDDASSDVSGRSHLTRVHTNAIINQDAQSEIRRIATQVSMRSGVSGGRARRSTTEYDPNDAALQPQSDRFDVSKWLSHFLRGLRDQGQPHFHPGVFYRDLNVSGSAPDLQVQQTLGTLMMSPLKIGKAFQKVPHKHILRDLDGILQGGELLVVLGRPGSGCSTTLKTLCGEHHGLMVDKQSLINYNGVPQAKMMKEYKGEMLYNQEVDKHFPHLTVGQTLEFAAQMRMSDAVAREMPRGEMAKYIAQVVMAVCGLSHTYDTKVGNEFIRGVSGGERKRVSIAEMLLAGSPYMAWDNSTRGLDSASALRFVQTLRVAADLADSAHAVAIYQASESIYQLFDKALVLYEGRQIYFGPATAARSYFERMGWHCPQRQTTGDFLTSVTNDIERQPRQGMENAVPRTPDEFEAYWKRSPEYQALREEIMRYEEQYPEDPHSAAAQQIRESKNFRQNKHVRPKSPYIISTPKQVWLNTKRAYQRMWNDMAPPVTTALTCLVLALIIGSSDYGTPDATVGFYAKASAIFMAVLLNALITITEINSLYEQRPIVEKHASYAFYHPATEAIAGVAADIPVKFVVAVIFNIILYFMVGLRREPGQFFIYFLFTYTSTFTMSAIFRTMAAMTKTISQAMSLAGIFILGLVIYTGFVIGVPEMHPWFSWIRWINPLFYTFEALVANEFHGREFTCSQIIPAYSPPIGKSWICSAVGSEAGRWTVNGDRYIEQSFKYSYHHVWRNYGILIGFLVSFMALYFFATEINTVPASAGEMLVYQDGKVPAHLLNRHKNNSSSSSSQDPEKGGAAPASAGAVVNPVEAEQAEQVHGAIEAQRDIFTWHDVVYDIEIKGKERRLLNHVAGWVKPGTLTALMGVSGAGKTTLLDVLAERTTMGVITGDMLVNGKPRGANFQRNTGYVQQQDLHLETATVRESLQFSAMLRQPTSVSKKEKYAFVEEVIDMLNMREFADAVVGIPGEGLNVEQRKLLTIGVELAAKPKLLLFLDEPTSGLDSQSSWAICAFLRKLADAGQAVLCTIHQPSAVLFEQFDRLLFLAAGGRTVYFGEVGQDSRTLLDYFESKGARACGNAENPAEYMLEIVNKTVAGDGQDWHETWNQSDERRAVDVEIDRIHAEKSGEASAADLEPGGNGEFAVPFRFQLWLVTKRIFQQYWRMPDYVMAKVMLGCIAGLFIGFSYFKEKSTLAGTQNTIFSVFQIVTIFTTMVQQIQPLFVTQRSLYEVRERPGKMYSWMAFMIANIVVEFPYQIFTGIVTFGSFYYPIVGIQSSQRQGIVLLFLIQLYIYASSFAHMCIAALPDAQTAGGIVTLLVMMSLVFCGVLQTPPALPGFWIFMYRVSPFTYWIAGVTSTFAHNREIKCSKRETSIFDPPGNLTCGEYMAPYLQQAPGRLQNPEALESCRYCQLSVADQFLEGSYIYWGHRWRNYGIVWAFVVFNIAVAIGTYYIFRVKKWNSSGMKKKKTKKA